jgi:hypothetical protein
MSGVTNFLAFHDILAGSEVFSLDTIPWNIMPCSQIEVNRLSKELSASVFRVED